MNNSDIKAIVDRVLSARLSTLGLDHIEVSLDYDDPDAPTLLVEAFMKSDVPSIGGKVVSSVHNELNQSLLSAGEERFPYLRVRYPTDETAIDGRPGRD